MQWFDVDLDKIFSEVSRTLVEFSQTGLGTIPKDNMILSSGIVDEQMLQQEREERLGIALAEEIITNDNIWADYEFEETQLKLDLGDIVLDQLLSETIDILNKL